MHNDVTLNYLSTDDGEKIAYKISEGGQGYAGPTLIWCGGLKSDMEGGKATHLHDWAIEQRRAYIRFDYFGLSRWAADVVRVIDELTKGDVILIGSSMGGWASLLAAINRPERVKGLLLIAPAPDFTQKLTWADWSEEQREALARDDIVYVPSDYDEPYEYSRALMEDGKARQIQGAKDPVVPWEYSRQILDVITSDDVDYTLVKDGDHSLSAPRDLRRLVDTANALCQNLSTT